MAYNFVLIHSPLIGPYSWRPVGDELENTGQRVVIPSLLAVLEQSSGYANSIAEYVRKAVDGSALPEPLVLVGHSAAGAYLPVIGAELDRAVTAYVFVDARLPMRGTSLADQDTPEEGQHRRKMAEDGMLPPWPEWFDEGVMAEVIPNEERRNRFVTELQPIPLALFHEEIIYPSDWPDAPCAYLRLSEFYKPLAQEASAVGWPVLEIDAEHLHLITHPQEVANLLLSILHELEAL
jgi:hypothetical protein